MEIAEESGNDSAISRSAIIGKCVQASLTLIFFLCIQLSFDFELALLIAIGGVTSFFAVERFRLGHDWRARQKAESEHISKLGLAPYAIGFFGVMAIGVAVLLAADKAPPASLLLLCIAAGHLGQAVAQWLRLMRVHQVPHGRS